MLRPAKSSRSGSPSLHRTGLFGGSSCARASRSWGSAEQARVGASCSESARRPEAQACGRPVVAYGRGGALETVVDGVTGALFGDPDAGSMAAALTRVASSRFDAPRLHAHAERFSRARHVDGMRAVIAETLAAGPGAQW